MLYVHRGPHIDPRFQNLPHILPAFRMAQAGGVRVGEFVDQQEFGPAFQRGVEVEFFQHLAAIGHLQPGQHFQRAKLLQRTFALVRLDHPGDDIHPGLAVGVGGDQHFPGFTDARRGAKENFQMAAKTPLHAFQQCIGVGPGVRRHAYSFQGSPRTGLLYDAGNWSRARFNCRTLT